MIHVGDIVKFPNGQVTYTVESFRGLSCKIRSRVTGITYFTQKDFVRLIQKEKKHIDKEYLDKGVI